MGCFSGVPIVGDIEEAATDLAEGTWNAVEETGGWLEDNIKDAGDWLETQWDYLSGDVAEEGKKLQDRSKALEAQGKALETKALDVKSEYLMEKFLYKDNAKFQFVVTASDVKYLKYIYPEEVAKLEALSEQLNIDIKNFQDKYDSGFLGTNDWLGNWLGGIITGIAMAVGNVVGFLSGKDGISFEDALKSAAALVALYFVIIYAPTMAPELMATFGFVIPSFAVYVVTTVVLVTLAIDSMFGGSEGLIATLDLFGQMFDKMGLTGGTNIFSKFFDSFKKDSDYNKYLVFAAQMFVAYNLMPSFESVLAGNYATMYSGYMTLSSINDAIKAHDEYQDKKKEYEQNLADMATKAIQTERDARLAKLAAAYGEGDSLANYTFYQQLAGGNQWMSYRTNGLFFGEKDSPKDLQFEQDLVMITKPDYRYYLK